MTEAAPTGTEAPVQDGTQVTPGDQPQSFSQKDVDKIAGNRAKEAEQRAINRVLEQSGAESLEDVLSVYEAHKLTQAEMETAADKAERAKTKAEERATAAEERYTNTLRDFALRDALRDAGVQSESLGFVMRGIDKSQLSVDKDGNVSGVEEAVGAAQEEAPMLFGGNEQRRARVNAPQTTGTGVQRPGSSGATDPQQAHAEWLQGLTGLFNNP